MKRQSDMNTGDRVTVRKYNVVGIITEIDGDAVIVVDDNGFEYLVSESEITPVGYCDVSHLMQMNCSLKNTPGHGKENSRKRESSTIRKPLEVDLHAEALVKDRKGLSDIDLHNIQKAAFLETLNREICHRGRQIVFIHGKGDGILRGEIIAELKRRSDKVSFQDAPFEKYGLCGAVKVTVK